MDGPTCRVTAASAPYYGGPLIVVPLVVSETLSDDQRKWLQELTAVGSVMLVAQGVEIGLRMEQVIVLPFKDRLGTWGALEKVRQNIASALTDGHHEAVVVNLHLEVFGPEAVAAVYKVLCSERADHVVGVRPDIQESLQEGSDNKGLERAALECFFSVLASLLSSGQPGNFSDAFTGLHCFATDRFLTIDWSWTPNTRMPDDTRGWGGALVTQIESLRQRRNLRTVKVSTRPRRSKSQAIQDTAGMIQRVLKLPLLGSPPVDAVDEALRTFADAYRQQEWLATNTLREDATTLVENLFEVHCPTTAYGQAVRRRRQG